MDFNLKGGGMPGVPSIPPNLPIILLVLGVASIGFGLLLLWNDWAGDVNGKRPRQAVPFRVGFARLQERDPAASVPKGFK